MLLTIAVLALLAVLAFPLLKNSQEKSRSAICAYSLRNIYEGWMRFSADRDGLVLPSYAEDGVEYFGYTWEDTLIYKVFTEEIHTPLSSRTPTGRQCPSLPSHRMNSWRSSNYVYNKWLGYMDSKTNQQWQTRQANLTNASRIAVLADAGQRTVVADNPDSPNILTHSIFDWVDAGYLIGYTWHPGYANFLFADGHAEPLTAAEAQARYDDKTLLLRRDNAWGTPYW